MSSQNLSWVGAPQAPRAPRISQHDWRRHEDILRDQYDKMTLKELMNWMKTHHNFSPSQHQYILQFEKWGLHKYGKAMEDNSDSQDKAPPATLLEGSTNNDAAKECKIRSASHVSEQPAKRKATQHEESRKRQKIASCANPVEPNHQNRASNVSSRAAVDEYFSLCDDGASNPFAVSRDQARKISEILQQLDGPNFTELVYGLDKTHAEIIMIVADFLAASQCPAEAFVLFLLILKRHRARQDLPQQLVEYALIGCTHSAITQAHADIAKDMVARHIEDLPSLSPVNQLYCHLQKSLYYLMLHKLEEDVVVSEFPQPHYVRSHDMYWPRYAIITAPHVEKPVQFEMAFIHHMKTFGKVLQISGVPQDVSLRDFETDLLGQTIRQFIDWCKVVVQSRNFFSLGTGIVGVQCASDHFAKFLNVYHGLFQACLQEVTAGCLLSWMAAVKFDLGVTSARFLAIASAMIQRHLPAREDTVSSLISQSDCWSDGFDDSELRHCVEISCHRLESCCDDDLGRQFFYAYGMISTGKWGNFELAGEQYERRFRPHVKARIEAMLDIKLPKLSALQIRRRTDRIPGETEKEEPKDMLRALGPTLAGSLHSSDYNSIKAMRERFRKALKVRASETRSLLSSRASSKGLLDTSIRFSMSEKWSLSQYLPRASSSIIKSADIDSIVTDCSKMSLKTKETEGKQRTGISVVYCILEKADDEFHKDSILLTVNKSAT